MVPQNAENGHFGKLHYAGGGYLEATRYINAQPLDARKKGFGSHDAKRRDEFSNANRTEQFRATIAKESQATAKSSEQLQKTLAVLMEQRAHQAELNGSGNQSPNSTGTSTISGTADFSYSSLVPQYDIGRARVTPFDPKSIKDTYYRFSTDRAKRTGDHKSTSNDYGDGSWQDNYTPPTFGGRSETKNFLDNSHLTTTL
jgi:hypothetical protein